MKNQKPWLLYTNNRSRKKLKRWKDSFSFVNYNKRKKMQNKLSKKKKIGKHNN